MDNATKQLEAEATQQTAINGHVQKKTGRKVEKKTNKQNKVFRAGWSPDF